MDCARRRAGGGEPRAEARRSLRADRRAQGARRPVRLARRGVETGRGRRPARERVRPPHRPGRRDQGAHRRRPLRQERRLLPRRSRQPASPRLRIRARRSPYLPPIAGRCLCTRRGGAGGYTPHRARVLVLLLLQRLQRQARRRLGRDPARLRRALGSGRAPYAPARSRLRPARGRRAHRLGQPEARALRHASPRLRRSRLPCEPLLERALARAQRERRFRLRGHARAVAQRAAASDAAALRRSGAYEPVRLARLSKGAGAREATAQTRARPGRIPRSAGPRRFRGSTGYANEAFRSPLR